jgi:hypothetical protein
MPKQIVIVKKSLGGNIFKMPPCVNQVTVEAYGYSSPVQCYIPLSGGAGTTATVCSTTYSLSNYGAGNYARSTLRINTGTVIYTANQCNIRSWANTASNVAPTVKTQGVSAGGGYSPYNTEALIGDVGYYGGRNGRKYLVNYSPGGTGKCPAPDSYGFVFGGLGGQAGPYGPGGNGSNAYPVGCYQTTTKYLPGAGGGANGGTSAVLGTPGVSRWGTSFSGGGGAAEVTTANFFITNNLGTVDPLVNLNSSYGPVSGGGGAISCINGPSADSLRGCSIANSGIVVITGYQNVPIPSGTYRYAFTICSLLAGTYSLNGINNIAGSSGVFSMCIPIGTTSTEVRVLGGGSNGNACNGVIGYTTSTSYPSAGGGGGGYARSTYTATVTATGVTLQVQVSHSYPLNVGAGYNSSSTVTINGVLEARAYSGYAARGGGCGGWGTNYARNGITNIGGWGGQGYFLSTVRKGGGGGGAAWDGGRGGYGANAQSGTTRGPGGGGSARCSAAGCNGSIGNATQGGRGGNSGGVAGTGGTTGTVALGGFGLNGGGGAGGGYASLVSTGGNGGTFALFTATNTYSVNVVQDVQAIGSLGPGGGGGGTYGGNNYTVTGGSGALYGGGGGGGGVSFPFGAPGAGANGLVAVTFIVCGTLSARYMNTASSSVSQSTMID